MRVEGGAPLENPDFKISVFWFNQRSVSGGYTFVYSPIGIVKLPSTPAMFSRWCADLYQKSDKFLLPWTNPIKTTAEDKDLVFQCTLMPFVLHRYSASFFV